MGIPVFEGVNMVLSDDMGLSVEIISYVCISRCKIPVLDVVIKEETRWPALEGGSTHHAEIM